SFLRLMPVSHVKHSEPPGSFTTDIVCVILSLILEVHTRNCAVTAPLADLCFSAKHGSARQEAGSPDEYDQLFRGQKRPQWRTHVNEGICARTGETRPLQRGPRLPPAAWLHGDHVLLLRLPEMVHLRGAGADSLHQQWPAHCVDVPCVWTSRSQ